MSSFNRRNPSPSSMRSPLPLSSKAGQRSRMLTGGPTLMDSIRTPLLVWKRSRLVRALFLIVIIILVIIALHSSSGREATGSSVRDYLPNLREAYSAPPHAIQDKDRSAPSRKKLTPVEIQLEEHDYLPNGLLEVNPRGRHPIYDLIARAEKEWERKLNAQSRTLGEAVTEYRKRYGRRPPRGFDKWWEYVERHHVQLRDEYDQILADLEMFYAYTPQDLRRLQEVTRQHAGTFTFRSSSSTGTITLDATVLNPNEEKPGLGRARNQLDLLHGYGETWLNDDGETTSVEREIVAATGDWEATLTSHDGPTDFGDWDLFEERRTTAKTGQSMDVFKRGDMDNYVGWGGACPHTSPLRLKHPDPPSLPLPEPEHKTFIYDHRAAMNPCDHPDLVNLIGFLSSHGLGPGPQQVHWLLFALCKTQGLHGDVLTVSSEGWTEDVGDDPEWKDKTDERLVWRGSSTGIFHGPGQPWRASQRVRLIEVLNERYGNHSVLPPTPPTRPVGSPVERDTAWLNHILADVNFVRGPMQCHEIVCPVLEKLFDWPRPLSQNEQNRYKYIIDIDGNGWASRFKRVITSNSLMLKTTIFPEWYMDRIMPWVHYVPIKVDLTDVYDVLMFFRGDVARGGEGGHDELAEKIATAGKQWSKTFFRREDMVAYMWRLFLEYGRLVNDDRDNMNFEL